MCLSNCNSARNIAGAALLQVKIPSHSYGLNYDVKAKSVNMDNISFSKIHAIPSVIFWEPHVSAFLSWGVQHFDKVKKLWS